MRHCTLAMMMAMGLLLIGCDDERDENLIVGGLVTGGTFSAMLDGESFVATEVIGSRSSDWQFLVQGEALRGDDTVNISLAFTATQDGHVTPDRFDFFWVAVYGQPICAVDYADSTSLITITAISQTEIEGTFSGVAVSAQDDTVVVTDGAFDVTYIRW